MAKKQGISLNHLIKLIKNEQWFIQ
jgi:hypothetical protein